MTEARRTDSCDAGCVKGSDREVVSLPVCDQLEGCIQRGRTQLFGPTRRSLACKIR